MCIEVELVGESIGPYQGFVPFQIEAAGWVQRAYDHVGVNDVTFELWKTEDGWITSERVTTVRSRRFMDRDGYISSAQWVRKKGTTIFQWRRPSDKYCAYMGLDLPVTGLKKRTAMDISARPSNPAPDEPFRIYGWLYRVEPDKKYLNAKEIIIMESADGGKTAYEIARVTTRTHLGQDGYWSKDLKKPDGTWMYWGEFIEDAEYEGCSEQVTPSPHKPVYFR